MSQDSAPVIRRADYQPLTYGVRSIELHFILDADRCSVHSRMHCVRNPRAAHGPLRLNGDGISLIDLRVDGVEPPAQQVSHSADLLEIDLEADEAWVELKTEIDPRSNTALSGLYLSGEGLYTQCEAEGFRRITWFPDRPDVMARFTVRLEADAEQFPVLLSNGNLIESGALPAGRHYAVWEDPFLKPSYLFALVAARLVVLERRVNTASGREVLLQVWVQDGQLGRAEFALDSLERALRWDETRYGLELDLDRYMIVATADFNMGAMENKGLNIFNAKYVLADPETATDSDFAHVEGVVAHEYFHNWTGNRVTCRDWFQLTLKEGLTVFRDQQFSTDMLAAAAGESGAASARAVKRIEDVRVLRSAQFPEDAGPMAHPIRPDEYREINNFYTATVYEKGAEVIRMLHTLLGPEGFRNGMDLYFEYFDGQAVTCDDFVDAFAEANGRDFTQFMRWYSNVGTPKLRARTRYEPDTQRYFLHLSQQTAGSGGNTSADANAALVIPVAVGLIAPHGEDFALRLEGETAAGASTRVLALNQAEQEFCFVDIPSAPVPSLLRGFSAPVILELEESDADLAFRMAHDSDPFNRWDASQRYAQEVLLSLAAKFSAIENADRSPLPSGWRAAFAHSLQAEELDPAFRALMMGLPGETVLLEAMQPHADPNALRAALVATQQALGQEFATDWLRLWQQSRIAGPYRYHPLAAGQRALGNLALRYLCAAGIPAGLQAAQTQLANAENMTERFGALVALVNSPDDAAREESLASFHARHAQDALVLDKWFAVQASAWRWNPTQAPALERVRALLEHPDFRIANPNKVYALLGSFFRNNPGEFHRADGAAYAFWAEQILALDARNPQVASRMARSLEHWQRFQPALGAAMCEALRHVAAHPSLSGDVREIVGRALARQ